MGASKIRFICAGAEKVFSRLWVQQGGGAGGIQTFCWTQLENYFWCKKIAVHSHDRWKHCLSRQIWRMVSLGLNRKIIIFCHLFKEILFEKWPIFIAAQYFKEDVCNIYFSRKMRSIPVRSFSVVFVKMYTMKHFCFPVLFSIDVLPLPIE